MTSLVLMLAAAAAEGFTLCGNLDMVLPQRFDWAFADIVKAAGPWQVVDADGTESLIYTSDAWATRTLALDDQGYPYRRDGDFPGDTGLQALRVTLPGGNEAVTDPLSTAYRELPRGDYTLFTAGTGTVRIHGGGFEDTRIECTGGAARHVVRRDKGRDPTATLEILASAAGDPLHDIHLVAPGCEDTFRDQPFHPVFLENIQPFAKYRLMDWSACNRSPIRHWEDRVEPGYYSYSPAARQIHHDDRALAAFGAGERATRWLGVGQVPYEVMCRLAEVTGRDIWLCLPAMADDDYVRRTAELFRDKLPEGRVLTVEYANEIFQFLAGGYGRVQGRLRYGDDGQEGRVNRTRFQVERMIDVYRIFNEVYGYSQGANSFDEPGRRLRFVMPYEHLEAFQASPRFDRVKVDHIIGNFYFGIDFPKAIIANEWYDRDIEFLIEQLAERLPDDRRLERLRDTVKKTEAFAAAHYPVTYVCYEGSSHFHDIWWNREIQDKTGHLTSAMLRHPRMYDFYEYVFQVLEKSGAVHDNYIYTITGGPFGHKFYPSQPAAEAPKYRVCVDYIEGKAKAP